MPIQEHCERTKGCPTPRHCTSIDRCAGWVGDGDSYGPEGDPNKEALSWGFFALCAVSAIGAAVIVYGYFGAPMS